MLGDLNRIKTKEKPKDPKDPSDSEYYINKNGKRTKRYYKKKNWGRKKKNELAKERYRKKAEAEGREIIQRESLVDLTEQEKDEHRYKKKKGIPT